RLRDRSDVVGASRLFLVILGSHNPLDVLYDARHHALVVVEFLGAVRDLDANLFANEFVVCALIDVLKTPPTANVVNQDMIEVGMTGPDVVKQLDQTRPVLELKPALTLDRKSTRL